MIISWPIDAVLLQSFSRIVELPSTHRPADSHPKLWSSLCLVLLSTLSYLSGAFFGEIATKVTPYNCPSEVTSFCVSLQQKSKDILETRLKTQLVWKSVGNDVEEKETQEKLNGGVARDLPLSRQECVRLQSVLSQDPHLQLLVNAVLYKMESYSDARENTGSLQTSVAGANSDGKETNTQDFMVTFQQADTRTEKGLTQTKEEQCFDRIQRDMGYVCGYSVPKQIKYMKEDRDSRKVFLLLRKWNTERQIGRSMDTKTIRELLERILYCYNMKSWVHHRDAKFILDNGILANEILLFFVNFYAGKQSLPHATATNIKQLVLGVSKISIHKDLPSNLTNMMFHNCINAMAAVFEEKQISTDRFREQLEDLLREELGELNLDSCCVCSGLKRLFLFARDGKLFP